MSLIWIADLVVLSCISIDMVYLVLHSSVDENNKTEAWIKMWIVVNRTNPYTTVWNSGTWVFFSSLLLRSWGKINWFLSQKGKRIIVLRPTDSKLAGSCSDWAIGTNYSMGAKSGSSCNGFCFLTFISMLGSNF